ncbi:hypothetical protein EAI_10876 [Harpegnathos saltator]|uniref:Uncharacterized protein n=1 Tax=Harpegnathos saltator TaxID=610380 RepID=E2B5W2_HARSA|nr:hypothetical protein EAI_10876 [Harpegnathos saltator]
MTPGDFLEGLRCIQLERCRPAEVNCADKAVHLTIIRHPGYQEIMRTTTYAERAVAATLGSTSSPASRLPCTGGLVSAPALGPVVAGTSLYTPPPQKSLSTKSERIRRQSPSQVRRRTAWDQKNPIPTTNHVSFGQTHCGLWGKATMYGGTRLSHIICTFEYRD